MNLKNSLISVLVISIILIYGCSTDTTYSPPAKVAPTQEQVETPPQAPVTAPILKVGTAATDNELKVTLNSVDFVSIIDEQDNEFMVAKAPSGKEYAIVDITVENVLPDKTQIVSTVLGMTVVDQDGYNYDIDFEGAIALDKGFKDGEILPGMKKRGQIAFLVPKGATDLRFIFKFDAFVGTSAVFDIK